MSAEPTQSVPFAAINVCLREDFLQRMIAQVLEGLPHASRPCVEKLNKELAALQIPGFRQFQRAPRGLQTRAAIRRFRDSGEVVGCMLEIWTDTRASLLPALEAFLKAHGLPANRLRAEEGQFRGRWSMDEVLRLADVFREEHVEADRDEVALLLCCLVSRAPVLQDAPDKTPAPAEATAPTTPLAAVTPTPPSAPVTDAPPSDTEKKPSRPRAGTSRAAQATLRKTRSKS